jgi:hypothetical protein
LKSFLRLCAYPSVHLSISLFVHRSVCSSVRLDEKVSMDLWPKPYYNLPLCPFVRSFFRIIICRTIKMLFEESLYPKFSKNRNGGKMENRRTEKRTHDFNRAHFLKCVLITHLLTTMQNLRPIGGHLNNCTYQWTLSMKISST